MTVPPTPGPGAGPGQPADDGRPPTTWYPAALPAALAEPRPSPQQPYPQQPYPQGFPYEQQPYPQQPPQFQPYAAQPYGAQPYGAQPYGARPYVGPYGQPWSSPYQPVPLRRGRRVAVLVVAALVTVLGATADHWTALLHDRPDIDQHAGAVTIARAQDLPQPESRGGRYPTPGFEEASAPLSVPPVAPLSTEYAFQDVQPGSGGTEVPVTWSPCRPIHITVNDDGAPPGFVDQVLAAFGDLSVATGLAVTYDGLTDEAPGSERALFQPQRYGDRWVPVVVEFSDAHEVGDLAGDVAGLTVTHILESHGHSHIVTAEVFLDSETLRMPDQRGFPAYISVLRHELGHVAGLDHVNDPDQLMYPWTTGTVTYQDGDRAGLAAVGQGSCAPSI